MTTGFAEEYAPANATNLSPIEVPSNAVGYLSRHSFQAYDTASGFVSPLLPEQNVIRYITLRNAIDRTPVYPTAAVRFRAGAIVFDVQTDNLFIMVPVTPAQLTWDATRLLRIRFSFEVAHIARPDDGVTYTMFFRYSSLLNGWARFEVPTELRSHLRSFGMHNVMVEVATVLTDIPEEPDSEWALVGRVPIVAPQEDWALVGRVPINRHTGAGGKGV